MFPDVNGIPLIVYGLGKIESILSHVHLPLQLHPDDSPKVNDAISLFVTVTLTYPFARSFLIFIKSPILTIIGPNSPGAPA
jgi:glutamate mutase epsilon subunit